MQRVAEERGFVNPSAFIRAAIRNELNGRESEISEVEQRLSATIEFLSQSVIRSDRGQQAMFAVVDTLVKTFLTCAPEPPADGMNQSVPRARGSYSRFIQSAGQSIIGASQAAFSELLNRAE